MGLSIAEDDDLVTIVRSLTFVEESKCAPLALALRSSLRELETISDSVHIVVSVLFELLSLSRPVPFGTSFWNLYFGPLNDKMTPIEILIFLILFQAGITRKRAADILWKGIVVEKTISLSSLISALSLGSHCQLLAERGLLIGSFCEWFDRELLSQVNQERLFTKVVFKPSLWDDWSGKLMQALFLKCSHQHMMLQQIISLTIGQPAHSNDEDGVQSLSLRYAEIILRLCSEEPNSSAIVENGGLSSQLEDILFHPASAQYSSQVYQILCSSLVTLCKKRSSIKDSLFLYLQKHLFTGNPSSSTLKKGNYPQLHSSE